MRIYPAMKDYSLGGRSVYISGVQGTVGEMFFNTMQVHHLGTALLSRR